MVGEELVVSFGVYWIGKCSVEFEDLGFKCSTMSLELRSLDLR